MKTLIFNASPRKSGETAGILKCFLENLQGEIFVVNCYDDKISPCIDCRKCREKATCVIDDYMQEVYAVLESCDNVVVASPIYFNQPTGRYLDVASRFQRYFSQNNFLKKPLEFEKKRGGIILTGGGSGNPQKAVETVKLTLKTIKVTEIFPAVISHNTDKISAICDKNAVEEVIKLAKFLNQKR